MKRLKVNVSISITWLIIIGLGIWVYLSFIKREETIDNGGNISPNLPPQVYISHPVFYQPHKPPGYYIFHKDSLRLIIPFSTPEKPNIPIIIDTTYHITIAQPPRIRPIFRTYIGVGINKSDKYALIGCQLLKIWDFYAGISFNTQKEINVSISHCLFRRFLIGIDCSVYPDYKDFTKIGVSVGISL